MGPGFLTPAFAYAMPWRARFDWIPTESAPKQFPMRLLRGYLVMPNGGLVNIPDHRDISNGWGKRGSIHISGEEYKPAPSRLELEWFSYTENCFYGGNWELPTAEMTALFRKTLPDPHGGPDSKFERIRAGNKTA